jgi:hypothetical protein
VTHVIRILVAAGICWMLAVPALVAAPLRVSLTIRPAGGAENGRGWTMFTEDGPIGLDVSFVVDEQSEAIALPPNFFRNTAGVEDHWARGRRRTRLAIGRSLCRQGNVSGRWADRVGANAHGNSRCRVDKRRWSAASRR